MQGKEGEYGAHKLDFHKDRITEFLEGKDIYPITIEIDLTNKCNWKCPWCSEMGWRAQHPEAEIPWQIMVRALKDMHRLGVRSVTIEGGGEPTIHPQFEEIVLSDTYGLQLGLITNGSMLHSFSEELIQRFVYIRVSLDAGSAQTHAKVKGCSEGFYPRILKALERAVALKAPGQSIGVSFIVSTDTKDEVYAAAVQCKATGVDNIQVKPIVMRDWQAEYLDISDQLKKIETLSEDGRFKVYATKMEGRDPKGPKRQYLFCKASRLIGAIAATGDVLFCCRLKNFANRNVSFGNIRFEPFEDIWKSGRRREFLQKAEHDPFFVGTMCINCRANEFNVAIEEAEKTIPPPLWRII